MTQSQIQVFAHVIVTNRLAGEYLVQVLATDRNLKAVLCETLPDSIPKSADNVFVMDNLFSPLPTAEALRRLKSLFPAAKFVIVDQCQSTQQLVALLQSGVRGFVEHREVLRSLCSAVRSVGQGRLWIPPEILQEYVELSSLNTRRLSAGFATTRREGQVLELAKRRLSNKEIAHILGVQESTVKYHLTNIYGKLQICSRHDLAVPQAPFPIWTQLIDMAPG